MNGTGFRVLVAEDEQTFGLTVARFLQKAGHEVKVCANGKSALKALDAAEWDVLLLDLKLPDADGVDILAHACARSTRICRRSSSPASRTCSRRSTPCVSAPSTT